jgi:putative Mg2+ transporter-C (MgtC) family protein
MIPALLVEYLIKILLSIILGGLIGLEREMSHHWAGLRTHALVSLGATLFMFITTFQYSNPQVGVDITIDATRLAAGVITGIGFLGAGVIFKEGANVKGLTTAASIWVTASVGLLVGIAMYELAILATVLILIVLYSDLFLQRYILKERRLWQLKLIIKDNRKIQTKIEKFIKIRVIQLTLKDFKREKETIGLIYTVILPKEYPKELLNHHLLENKNVLGVEWEV